LQFRQPFTSLGFCQVVTADNVRPAGLGQFQGLFKKWAQFGEHRDRSGPLAVVAVGLEL
jgi:hypothetical protein